MGSGTRSRSAHERYPSKYDWWILALIIGTPCGVLAAMAFDICSAPQVGLFPELALLLSFPLLYGGIIVLIAMPINYDLEDRVLHVRAGLLVRLQVPLAGIVSIRPTRNPLSSPAGSLDRLRIDYRIGDKPRAVMISPADKAGFLLAVMERQDALVRQGSDLVRPEER